jgi:hypothetical protein
MKVQCFFNVFSINFQFPFRETGKETGSVLAWNSVERSMKKHWKKAELPLNVGRIFSPSSERIQALFNVFNSLSS